MGSEPHQMVSHRSALGLDWATARFEGLAFGSVEIPAPSDSVSPTRRAQLKGCVDLTTLSGSDTPAVVTQLAKRALETGVAAVCVFPALVPVAQEVLRGSSVKVATVAAAFPHGLARAQDRVAEVLGVQSTGVDEIDIVIPRYLANESRWEELYDDLVALRAASAPAHLKVILSTGELLNQDIIARASLVAIAAGADFVKTSTGKEAVNATLEAGQAMLSAMQIAAQDGLTVGIKPAGGIRTAREADQWATMVEQAMGPNFISATNFRIGASALLDELL